MVPPVRNSSMIVVVRQHLHGLEAVPSILQDVELITLQPAEEVGDHQVSILDRSAFLWVDVQSNVLPELLLLVLLSPLLCFRAESRDHLVTIFVHIVPVVPRDLPQASQQALLPISVGHGPFLLVRRKYASLRKVRRPARRMHRALAWPAQPRYQRH